MAIDGLGLFVGVPGSGVDLVRGIFLFCIGGLGGGMCTAVGKRPYRFHMVAYITLLFCRMLDSGLVVGISHAVSHLNIYFTCALYWGHAITIRHGCDFALPNEMCPDQ